MNEDICEWAGCGNKAVAALDSRPLCQSHFHEIALRRLEGHQDSLRRAEPAGAQAIAILKFLSEVISQATTLVVRDKSLSLGQRDQLHQLSLSALKLYQRVQRDPRLPLQLPILLYRETGVVGNMERTSTVNVSARGACIATSGVCIANEKLWIQKTTTPLRALARVAWARKHGPTRFQVGIELLEEENFWGLETAGSVKTK